MSSWSSVWVRCLGTFDGVEPPVAQKRSVDQSAGKLKLISKGLNISGEVLLDHGFGLLIIVITVSGPINSSSSVGQSLLR